MKIQIPQQPIIDFCRRWNVVELSLFGSALREDFGAASDIDILVTFSPSAKVGFFDFSRMQEELEKIFGRKVDLLSRRGIENSRNYLRRKEILDSAEVVYAHEG